MTFPSATFMLARLASYAFFILLLYMLWNASDSVKQLEGLQHQQQREHSSRPSFPRWDSSALATFDQLTEPSYYLKSNGRGVLVARSLNLAVTRNPPELLLESSSPARNEEAQDELLGEVGSSGTPPTCTPDAMSRALATLRSLLKNQSIEITNENLNGLGVCTTTGVSLRLAVPTDELDELVRKITDLLVTTESPTKNDATVTSSFAEMDEKVKSAPATKANHWVHPGDRDGSISVLHSAVFTKELPYSSTAVVGPLEVARIVARRRYERYHAVVYQQDLDVVLQRSKDVEEEEEHEEEGSAVPAGTRFLKRLEDATNGTVLNVSRAMKFMDGMRDVQTNLLKVEHDLRAAKEKFRTLSATLELQLVDRDVRQWNSQQKHLLRRLERQEEHVKIIAVVQVVVAAFFGLAAWGASKKAASVAAREKESMLS